MGGPLFTAFRQAIMLNEVGENEALIYKFSDPDGVNSGKSGYSFGLCQFDTQNNPVAITCLRECGFTTDEIQAIRFQTLNEIAPYDKKLSRSASIVDAYDDEQLKECWLHTNKLCLNDGIKYATVETWLHLADYHNQFYMSEGGKMHTHLKELGRDVTPEDIRDFKLTLLWGRKRPDDVHRRFENIRDTYLLSL